MITVYKTDEVGFFTEAEVVATGLAIPEGALIDEPPAASGSLEPRSVRGKWALQEREDSYTSQQTAAIIPIAITDFADGMNVDSTYQNAIVKELVPFTITADVPLPVDDTFVMPITRIDTGRTVFILATIASGVMTMTANLPTAGEWVCGEAQVNSKLEFSAFKFSFAGINILAVQ